MVAKKRPPKKKIKFELTLSGIAGVGVVTFCLFLWMFLLGVWAGQSLLLPSYEKKQIVKVTTPVERTVQLIIKADQKPRKNLIK